MLATEREMLCAAKSAVSAHNNMNKYNTEAEGPVGKVSPHARIRVRNNKSVRFTNVSRSDIHEVDYIPRKYANDVWYSSLEYRRIMEDIDRYATNYYTYMNKSGNNNKDMKHVERKTNGTIRGIEYLIDENLDRQSQLRRGKSIGAVMIEQHRQNKEGWVIDHSLIADVYSSNGSKEAQLIANKIALDDESSVSNVDKKSNKIAIKMLKRPLKLSGILFPKKREVSCTAA